jgi:hypothetical protein
LAAIPLRIAANAPECFKTIARHIDLHLGDLHSLLRLPLPANGEVPPIEAAGNFAIANVLFNLVSGVSTVVYRGTRRDSGARFRRLLEGHYPWALEPQSRRRIPDAECPAILYDMFRNPNAHALAIHTTEDGGFIRSAQVIESFRMLARQLEGNVPFTEQQLQQLEATDTRPSGLAPTMMRLTDSEHPQISNIVLSVEAFYWGVRRMIEDLSINAARMRTAAWFFRVTDQLPPE